MALLPSPRTSDMNGAGHHGDGGMDLRTAVSLALLPTPTTRDTKGENIRGDDTCLTGALLPTPRATDGTKGGPNQRGSSGDLMLPSAVSLLPTPTAQDSAQSGGGYNGQTNVTLTDATVRQPARWGEYEPAIRRWEAATRPAPAPTKPNAKGNPKLSDEFDEWLMGFPKGWITDVPGITWNEVLKACGNGVVWQQGSAALRWLIVMGAWEVSA